MRLFFGCCIFLGVVVAVFGFFSTVLAYDVRGPWFSFDMGRVVEKMQFVTSPRFALPFGYCNPQSCGNSADPEFDCYVGLYNPSFGKMWPDPLIVPSISSCHEFDEMFLTLGDQDGNPSFYGYYSARDRDAWNGNILESAPELRGDGGILLHMKQDVLSDFFKNARRGYISKRICGLGDNEYQAFRKKYGDSVDVSKKSLLKVSVLWRAKSDAACVGETSFRQQLTLDEEKRSVDISLPLEIKNSTKIQVFRQDNSAWRETPFAGSTISKKGTVPVLVASLLSHYGIAGDPIKIAQELEKQGISNVQGTDWNRFRDYLGGAYNLTMQPSGDVRVVISHLSIGPVVAAHTRTAKNALLQEGALLLISYDVDKDSFVVVDPRFSKTTSVSYDELMRGNPWFGLVTKNK